MPPHPPCRDSHSKFAKCLLIANSHCRDIRTERLAKCRDLHTEPMPMPLGSLGVGAPQLLDERLAGACQSHH